MHDLNLIACVSQDGGLGRDGKLLWQIPEDMQFFKRTTMGHPVIMGRKTFQSIGRALPGRDNIILSRTKGDQHNITWCNAAELDTWRSSSARRRAVFDRSCREPSRRYLFPRL